MRLYLVRHPKPLVAAGVCYGASDVVCSHEALESAAHHLRGSLPKGLKMISSPLSRCEQLAQILCRLEPNFAYKTDKKLVEMYFGAWEMQTWDSIAQSELQAWTDDFANLRCGGSGESTAQFVQRVAERLFESLQSGEDQVWITHAGVIRAVQWLNEKRCGKSSADFIAQLDRAWLLSQLRAADWPKGEVAFGQVHPLHWGRP
jgi:alpha-ribazole phosphatase